MMGSYKMRRRRQAFVAVLALLSGLGLAAVSLFFFGVSSDSSVISCPMKPLTFMNASPLLLYLYIISFYTLILHQCVVTLSISKPWQILRWTDQLSEGTIGSFTQQEQSAIGRTKESSPFILQGSVSNVPYRPAATFLKQHTDWVWTGTPPLQREETQRGIASEVSTRNRFLAENNPSGSKPKLPTLEEVLDGPPRGPSVSHSNGAHSGMGQESFGQQSKSHVKV